MGFYTGRSGSLVFNGKPVAKIRDWSLETTVELLSTSTIDSTASTFTPGIKGATGSATLVYYRLESGESATYTEFTALLAVALMIISLSTLTLHQPLSALPLVNYLWCPFNLP
jgi:hypothetical protein